MKLLKKNQIVIYVIALMLMAVAYLNYTTNTAEQSVEASLQMEARDDSNTANIGDATLVSSNAVQSENTNEEMIENTVEAQENVSIETTQNTIENDYFASSRLEREKMYSQMLESYQTILESSEISDAQKEVSQTEINKINNTKNAIMIAENLLKTKDIEDIILLVNDKSINVVVKTDKLSQDKVAQIQNIVSREMNAEIDNIHITEYK